MRVHCRRGLDGLRAGKNVRPHLVRLQVRGVPCATGDRQLRDMRVRVPERADRSHANVSGLPVVVHVQPEHVSVRVPAEGVRRALRLQRPAVRVRVPDVCGAAGVDQSPHLRMWLRRARWWSALVQRQSGARSHHVQVRLQQHRVRAGSGARSKLLQLPMRGLVGLRFAAARLHVQPDDVQVRVHRAHVRDAEGRRHRFVQLQVPFDVRSESGAGPEHLRVPLPESAARRERVRELPCRLHLQPDDLSVRVLRPHVRHAEDRRHRFVQLQVPHLVRSESGAGSEHLRLPLPESGTERVCELPHGLHLQRDDLSVRVRGPHVHSAEAPRPADVQLQVPSDAVSGQSGAGSHDVWLPLLRLAVPCWVHAEPDDLRL